MAFYNEQPTQTLYDPQLGQYYTQSYQQDNGTNAQHPLLRGMMQSPIRNYLQPQNTQPQISSLVAQAMAAKPNVPTMGQLFPGMSAPNMGGMFGNANGTGGLLGGYTAQGQYGAGRFLGNNIMGNPSLTSTAMNT